ncbi:GTPase IMAP family member 5-like [Astyanax mexicanus]|uniref:GTPase IMAP family member 5-like n=1 Tax=Astyanax mexicanus TaxID=7994 RepID=UPI0020CB0F58|nr:GTPase IMAP family member 5-like [Astyanax mexicanus]
MSVLNIVLLGENGAEQRSTGNSILGRAAFREDFSSGSLNRQCESERQEGTVDGRSVSVIISPGLLDSSVSEEDLKAGLDQCSSLLASSPGPHLFLLLIRVGNFIEDQRNTVKWIQENFGEDALNSTMVLFTGALHQPPEDYLKKHSALRKLVHKCKAGFHVFRNDPAHLLEKMEGAVQQNGGERRRKEVYGRKDGEEEKKKKNSEGKAELIIRSVGKMFGKLLQVILKAVIMEICAVFRSALQGFGIGLIIIVALSLTGILTQSWICFLLKLLIFGMSGVIGALIRLNSEKEMNRQAWD